MTTQRDLKDPDIRKLPRILVLPEALANIAPGMVNNQEGYDQVIQREDHSMGLADRIESEVTLLRLADIAPTVFRHIAEYPLRLVD